MKRIKLANRVGRLRWMLAAALIAAAWVSSGASAQTLNTLVTFGGGNGAIPEDRGRLIADAHGNLFGTTGFGGTSSACTGGCGTVFEIKVDSTTATGYASTPTTLVSFNGTDGAHPFAGLIADASGNLFGTTCGQTGSCVTGGGFLCNVGCGTVFEIKVDSTTPTGYASTPTTLVSFNFIDGPAAPYGGLIADAHGNLFGTTVVGGANLFFGTVFEIKTDSTTATGYASAPTTLVSFNQANGQYPFAGVIADASGNLFGTTNYGGGSAACPLTGGCGEVFEIKVDSTTATGYANTPTILVSFDGTDGAYPESDLIADAHGNLFGTTSGLSANTGLPPSHIGFGTVFELKVDSTTATGYASTPITLVSFNGIDGATPFGGLIADASGNLFGTTSELFATGFGTVFEVKTDSTTATGYASTATTLAVFNGADGAFPIQVLIADSHGNLFGTAEGGGTTGKGTVFEVTDSGFVPNPVGVSLTMGPQAMEGNLKLSPGATLQAGYDFTMPGNHPAATVSFFGAEVTFAWTCASGPGSGALVVPMANQSYTDPQNSSAWYPSGDQKSSLVYQGSITVPNVCSGGLVSFQAGGTFSTGVSSTDTRDKVNVRWHYRGGGSAGGWSATRSVVP